MSKNRHGWPAILVVMLVALTHCQGAPRQQHTPQAQPQPGELAKTPPQKVQLVLLGDSLARGTGDESGIGFAAMVIDELERRNLVAAGVVNLALDGARTREVLEQLKLPRVRRLIADADLMVLSIGANDVFVQVGGPGEEPQQVIDRVLARLDQVLSQIAAINPRARVFLIGLYNPFLDSSFSAAATSLVQRWNGSLMARYDRRSGVTVVQTFDLLSSPGGLSFDRLHPSAAGYRKIAERIAQEADAETR